MARRFINSTAKCATCFGELGIIEFQVDLVNCLYLITCECINCGQINYLTLSLLDFIELSQEAGG